MKVPDPNRAHAPAFEQRETRIKARSVSRGIAIGKIVCLYGRNRQYYRTEIDPATVDAELRRVRVAMRLARRQLHAITRMRNGSIPEIFDAQMAMLADSSLQTKIETEIAERFVNAEWAVNTVTDLYVTRMRAIPDDYLRERYIDLEDVAERILAALGDGRRSTIELNPNSIIAAKELRPSTLVEMTDTPPAGLITEHGGWTSHTFILARELGLPSVTGVTRLLRRVETGDSVIIDGYNGEMIVHPHADTLEQYRRRESGRSVSLNEHAENSDQPAKTLDGREVVIRANLDIPSVYKKAKQLGARGIGLYRSEFLFNQVNDFPSENEQFEAYRRVADLSGEDGVKIRTFDIGTEQFYGQYYDREKNPALGLRAIRLGLSQPKTFRTQIRALLRAAHERNVSIIIPMVSGVAELLEAKRLIDKETKILTEKGIAIGSPEIGVMIEIPSAVLMIDELLARSDFVCLGTNDLVQYLLAVDRDNESVANWFRTLHPAVIRAVRTVAEAARNAGKPCIVCGEMAGSAFYLPLLVGLGVTELSMNVNSIRSVRAVISGIAFEEAKDLAAAVDDCATADDIEETIRAAIKEKWGHLFPENV